MSKQNGAPRLDDKKTITSWVLYDWANSAFATTVIAGFFPSFFESFWVTPLVKDNALALLGFGNSIASIIVAAIAPFLGSIADNMSGKKKFLLFFAVLGIIMTGGLWLLAAGQWVFAILFYVTGAIGFSGANIFYDSLLPAVASKKKADYVSSLGFAIGYIGGGLLFTVNVLMFLLPGLFGLPNEIVAVQVSFLTVAIWWAGFSIPIFLFVKEPVLRQKANFKDAIGLGMKQLKETFNHLRALKIVALFLFAYWFYIDGVDTIIRMAVIYGQTLGFDSTALIGALLITQFVAFPGTILYNKFAQKIGVKNGVLVAIGIYCVITVVGFFMQNEIHFFSLAIAIGFVQGGIQALSRSLYNRIIPADKAAQFFGFFNMLGKFAAVIGPSLMAVVQIMATGLTGDTFLATRYSILSILVLFIIGAILLAKVDIEQGEKMSEEFLAEI